MTEILFKRKIHIYATIIHYAAVIFVFTFGKGWKVPVILSWNEWIENPNVEDEFAILTYYQDPTCNDDGCNSPQAHVRLMVGFFSIISGTHHLFASVFPTYYQKQAIENGVNIIRWTDYAFSSGLMIVVNTFLLKTPADFATVVAVFLVQFMVCLGGAASEYAWSKGYNYGAKVIFWSFFLPFILLWATNFIWLGYTHDHSKKRGEDETMPAFVWVYFFLLFAGFLLFPIIHLMKLKKFKSTFDEFTQMFQIETQQDSEKQKQLTSLLRQAWELNAKEAPSRAEICINSENKYAAASITAKVPLLLLFAVSLERENLEFSRDSVVTDDLNYNPIADNITIFITVGVSLIFCFAIGIYFTYIDKFDNMMCCSKRKDQKGKETVQYTKLNNPAFTSYF